MSTKSVRLNESLVESAERSSAILFRTAPKQIEYWASIGRKIESTLRPSEIAKIIDGSASVTTVEETSMEDFSLDAVNEDIEFKRSAGTLKKALVGSDFWYDISKEHEGYLERINSDGEVTVGKFSEGKFVTKVEE
ncbi:MAG: hypothetical protein KAG61_09770 [Bacteriovoracaceae bacterium]|nr:hypothetical protein [Bacteriovoracaceae bacterium]